MAKTEMRECSVKGHTEHPFTGKTNDFWYVYDGRTPICKIGEAARQKNRGSKRTSKPAPKKTTARKPAAKKATARKPATRKPAVKKNGNGNGATNGGDNS